MNLRSLIKESLWKSMEELTLPNAHSIDQKYDSHPGKENAVNFLLKRELEDSFKLQMLHVPDKVFYVPFKTFRSMHVEIKAQGINDIERDERFFWLDGKFQIGNKIHGASREVYDGNIICKLNFEYHLEPMGDKIEKINQDANIFVYLNFQRDRENDRKFIITPESSVQITMESQSNNVMKVTERNGATKLESLINTKIIEYFMNDRSKRGKRIEDKFIITTPKVIHRNQLMIY